MIQGLEDTFGRGRYPEVIAHFCRIKDDQAGVTKIGDLWHGVSAHASATSRR